MANTPAEDKAIFAIAACGATADDRTLRTAPRVKAEPRVIFTQAVFHEHVVGLLEANAVTGIIPHGASLDHSPKATIKKYSGAATAIEWWILGFIAIDN